MPNPPSALHLVGSLAHSQHYLSCAEDKCVEGSPQLGLRKRQTHTLPLTAEEDPKISSDAWQAVPSAACDTLCWALVREGERRAVALWSEHWYLSFFLMIQKNVNSCISHSAGFLMLHYAPCWQYMQRGVICRPRARSRHQKVKRLKWDKNEVFGNIYSITFCFLYLFYFFFLTQSRHWSQTPFIHVTWLLLTSPFFNQVCSRRILTNICCLRIPAEVATISEQVYIKSASWGN